MGALFLRVWAWASTDGVVVGVDRTALRGDALCDLVGVLFGGDPGADLEELADAGLPSQIAHGTGVEGLVVLHRGSGVVETTGARRSGEVGDLAVGGEVVVSAADLVIHPSRVRDVVGDLDRFGPRLTPLARGLSGGHDDSPGISVV